MNQDPISSLTNVLQQILQRMPEKENGRNDYEKPPSYNGSEEEDLNLWLFKTNQYFTAKRLAENEMLRRVPSFLDKAALSWFIQLREDISNGSSQPIDTWTDFENAIKQNFEAPNQQQLLRSKMRRLKQGDSIRDYVTAFRNMLAKITDMSEDDRIHYFVSGLRDNTRSECEYKAPATFSEAVIIAQNFDNSKFGRDSRQARNSSGGTYQNSSVLATNQSKVVPMELGFVKQANKAKSTTQQKHCQFHKSNTHSDAECRRRREERTKLENNSFNLVEDYLNQVNGNSGSLTVLSGLIDEKPAKFLIDSGSSHDHLSLKFAESSGLELIDISPRAVSLADGSTSECNKIVKNAKVHIGAFVDKVSFRVIKLHNYDAILGRPWLFRNNPKIDWRENSLQIATKTDIITLRSATETPVKTLFDPLSEEEYAETGELYLVDLSVRQEETNASSLDHNLQLLTEKFKELFQEKLANLPPKRLVQHEITLIPNANPISKPTFRMSPKELDVLRSDLEEQLSKGLIRPSQSP